MRIREFAHLAVLWAASAAPRLLAEESPRVDTVLPLQESKQWVLIQGMEVTHLDSWADFQKTLADASKSDREQTKFLIAASKLTEDFTQGRKVIHGRDCEFVILAAEKTVKGKAEELAFDAGKNVVQFTNLRLQSLATVNGVDSDTPSEVRAQRLTLDLKKWSLRIDNATLLD